MEKTNRNRKLPFWGVSIVERRGKFVDATDDPEHYCLTYREADEFLEEQAQASDRTKEQWFNKMCNDFQDAVNYRNTPSLALGNAGTREQNKGWIEEALIGMVCFLFNSK